MAMKPALQRIAIAEVCGWRQAKSEFADKPWIRPDGYRGGIGVNAIPDYLNDLNAMAEAEKVLGKRGLAEQLQYLHLLSPVHSEWTLATSTATQRAEAFLRTMGRWVE